jgi:hypothetical protein
MGDSYVRSLQRIFDIAEDVKARARPYLKPSDPSPSASDPTSIPALQLPQPEDISPMLERRGLLPEIIRQLSSVYSRGVRDIRARCEIAYHNLCNQLSDTPFNSNLMPLPLLFTRVQSLHQKRYEVAVCKLHTTILASCDKAVEQAKRSMTSSKKCKNRFNPVGMSTGTCQLCLSHF